MKLDLISPICTLTYDVAWLELHTSAGNFVIQKGHIPTLLVLSPNKDVIFRLKNGKEESITIQSGIAEITRESAIVLFNEQL